MNWKWLLVYKISLLRTIYVVEFLFFFLQMLNNVSVALIKNSNFNLISLIQLVEYCIILYIQGTRVRISVILLIHLKG
jgi:hypothetical protein